MVTVPHMEWMAILHNNDAEAKKLLSVFFCSIFRSFMTSL